MSAKAIQRLVAAAREKFALDFSTSPMIFDDPVWDVRSLFDRTVSRSTPRIYFTRHANTSEPLPAEYALVVKSWLILDRRSPRNMGARLVRPAYFGKPSWLGEPEKARASAGKSSRRRT